MSAQRRRGIASALLATSLLLMMMSISGSWGVAYGQSGGPTPTIELTIVAPGGGAEGDTPARPEAVAGESGEAGEGAARPEAVAGESGEAAESGAGSASELPQSGAESAVQWPLLAIGVALFAAGAILFRRTRTMQS